MAFPDEKLVSVLTNVVFEEFEYSLAVYEVALASALKLMILPIVVQAVPLKVNDGVSKLEILLYGEDEFQAGFPAAVAVLAPLLESENLVDSDAAFNKSFDSALALIGTVGVE